MFCGIPHIYKDAKYHLESYHGKHVRNLIKTLFRGLLEDQVDVTQDIFLTEYTELDNKNDSFHWDKFK